MFVCLRGLVLSDWINYYPFYAKLPSLLDGVDTVARCLEKATLEKGFVLYAILVKTISGSYFFFTFVSSLIDFIVMFWAFSRYAPGQVVLCFAFFWIFDGISLEFQVLRNIKSMMLFLISIKYAQERRIVPYLLLNILGVFFHVSSLVYLPLYFIITRRFPFSFYVLLFVVGNVIYLFQIKWVSSVFLFLADILPGTRVSSKIVSYMNNIRTNFGLGISIGYIERFFTYILVLYFLRRLCKEDKSNIVFVNLTFICVLAQLYLSEMNILPDRFANLFDASYWIIYPKIYSLLRRKDLKWLFVVLLLLYGVLKLSRINSLRYLYDNVLWLQYSFEERKPLSDAWLRFLNERTMQLRSQN